MNHLILGFKFNLFNVSKYIHLIVGWFITSLSTLKAGFKYQIEKQPNSQIEYLWCCSYYFLSQVWDTPSHWLPTYFIMTLTLLKSDLFCILVNVSHWYSIQGSFDITSGISMKTVGDWKFVKVETSFTFNHQFKQHY